MFQSIKQNKVDFKLYVLDSFLSLNEVSTINWSFKLQLETKRDKRAGWSAGSGFLGLVLDFAEISTEIHLEHVLHNSLKVSF